MCSGLDICVVLIYLLDLDLMAQLQSGLRQDNMSRVCHVCGAVYEWDMYFHNHLRTVHGIRCGFVQRARLGTKSMDFLDAFFCNMNSNPDLKQIEDLAKFLDVKKESVYWWFFNRRQRARRQKRKTGNSQNLERQVLLKSLQKKGELIRDGDTDDETAHDGVFDRVAERGKTETKRRGTRATRNQTAARGFSKYAER